MSNQLVSAGIGVAGLLFGSMIGYVAYKAFNPPETIVAEPEIIKEEISIEELEELCAELTSAEKANVLEVQGKVRSLQEQLIEKEAELERLKKEAKKSGKSKDDAKKKWKEMEEEIARLQIQLASAEQERDDLKKELQQTLVKLDKQIKETKKFKTKAKKYKRESTQNLWSAFKAQAKVKGCNRGTKKRHSKCYEAFDSSLNSDVRSRFKNCVDSYQAVPVLKKQKRGEGLPKYSKHINQGNKFTKGWYVMYCDPTLPEARDTDLDDEPIDNTIKEKQNDEFDLDIDLDDLPEK
jgi:hypothetical protein